MTRLLQGSSVAVLDAQRRRPPCALVGALTGTAMVIALGLGCSGPPGSTNGADAAEQVRVVRGHALGIRAPVELELRVDGALETLTVHGDGPFVFATPLLAGAAYSATLRTGPECVLDTPDEVARDVDATLDSVLTLTCRGVVELAAIDLSGARDRSVAIDPGRYDYATAISVVQESVRLSPRPWHSDGVSVQVAGEALAPGQGSSALAIPPDGDGPGAREVSIDVDFVDLRGRAWRATYTLTVERSVAPVQGAYIKASNPNAQDQFGGALALSADGQVLAAGARYEASVAAGVDGPDNDNSAPGSGAVYLFARHQSSWEQVAYLKASNSDPDDGFGHSLAMSASGDVLVVGAPGESSGATGVNAGPPGQDDDSAPGTGAVYVFTHGRDGWQQSAYIKPSNRGGAFGRSVALSGNGRTLAVGATVEASAATGVDGDQFDTSAPAAGAVYVFVEEGSSWRQQSYLKASNTGANDQFGGAVALSENGDALAVGAHGEDGDGTGPANDGALQSGAVYLFARTEPAGWSQSAYLKPAVVGAVDLFGARVALSASGATLAVSALGEDSAAQGPFDGDGGAAASDDGAAQSGAVYVFQRGSEGWLQRAFIKSENSGAGDIFGDAIALTTSGDGLLVGAAHEAGAGPGGDDALPASGAVYGLVRAGESWIQRAYLKADNAGAGDRFGHALAVSAHADIIAIGAYWEASRAAGVDGDDADDTRPQSGAVYDFR